jgi:hypothetical protein
LVQKNNPTELIEEANQFIPSGRSWEEIDLILNNETKGTNQAQGEKCYLLENNTCIPL